MQTNIAQIRVHKRRSIDNSRYLATLYCVLFDHNYDADKLTDVPSGKRFSLDSCQAHHEHCYSSYQLYTSFETVCKHQKIVIVIVITFYSPSCLGQETAKGSFGLRVKLPPAHLSTTHDGGFTQSLLMLNVKQESCEYQFLQSLVWPDRESNPSLSLQ